MTQSRSYNEEYAITWDKITFDYGVKKNEEFIINLILKLKPQSAFEIGIGNGWPYAIRFVKSGVHVSGCDISPALCQIASERIGGGVFVGDIRELNIARNFDLTYCIRTTWMMPQKDFLEILDKMISVTRNGGFVVFDILHRYSLSFFKYIIVRALTLSYRKIKGILTKEREVVFPPPNYFYDMRTVEEFLISKHIRFEKYCEEKHVGKKFGGGVNSYKVLYLCKKVADL